jgi:hypothetical protein
MSELEAGKARMTHPITGADEIVDAGQVPHLEHAGWRFEEGDRDTWPQELQRFDDGAPGVHIRNLNTGGATFVPELTGHLRERAWVEVGSDEDRAAQADKLEDKTVVELKELAKDRGISPIPTTKAELIEALEDSQDSKDQTEAGEKPAATSEEEEG